jgi:hypothetical protein
LTWFDRRQQAIAAHQCREAVNFAHCAGHGLEEFTQAEQLAQYRDTYGSALQRQARRQRLIERQLAALAWNTW